MTGEWLFYLIIFLLMAIAVIATILVGVSKTNREGNPGYFNKTDKKLTRLTLYYVVCFGAALIALIAFIHYK